MPRATTVWMAVLALTGGAIAVVGAREAQLRLEETTARAAAFERLRGEIALSNEALTTSARLYALTGERAWLDRNDAFVGRFDAAIEAALALADSDVARAALAQVHAAREAMILMETQSFAFVAEGRRAEALAALDSEGYRSREAAYAEGLAQALRAAGGRVAAGASRDRTGVALLVGGLGLAFLGALWTWGRARRESRAARERSALLAERGDLLRALLADAPVAIALFDSAGRCVAASGEFAELFGVTPGAAPADPHARAALAGLLALPPGRPRADWIESGAGPARWVWRETREWRDSDGRRAGLIAAAADFTDLRQLQNAYRAAHAQADELGAVLEEARQEVFVFDADTWRFVHVNRGARENLGYTADEFARMTPLDLKPEVGRAEFEAILAPLLAGRTDLARMETVHQRRDGTRYPCEVRLSLRGDPGARRFVAMVDDITERRAREAERARVTERLRLSEVGLRAALEEADRASRLKSEFLARMTHEIRTPLNGILGGVALIRSSDDAETRAKWLGIVEASARALQRVIDDVLDIAQIEAGAESVETVGFDPCALVERLVAQIRPDAQAKGLVLRLTIGAEAPKWWSGDPRRLGRVVGALVENAIKFTVEGIVAVRVGGGEDRLRVEVADTGPGVPEAEQEAIFERFRQVDGSTTRAYGGVGLGLSIAREFTHMMGGRIGLRSRPGEGATFWIEFDARPAGDARALQIPAALDAGESPAEGDA